MTILEAHCWSFLFILIKYIIVRKVGEPIWDASFKPRHELIKTELERVFK